MDIPFFEQAENAGIINGAKVNLKVIERMSSSDIVDFSEQYAESTSIANTQISHTPYTAQSASVSLGAGRRPCAAFKCRAKKLSELAQYVAFYADKVYIENFLGSYNPYNCNKENESSAKLSLTEDLKLLTMVRPLIEQGQIIPVSGTQGYCSHCLIKKSVDTNSKKRFDKAYRWLVSRIRREINVNIDVEETILFDEIHAKIEGPEEMIEHGAVYHTLARAPKADLITEILQAETELIKMNALTRRRYGVNSELANEILESIAFDLDLSQRLKASFVTERQIHIDILNRITNDVGTARRNMILQNHLQCMVPFLQNVSVIDLMRLRSAEGDAFQAFRSSLTKAVDTYLTDQDKFTEKDAATLYADVLQPKLAQLDQKVSVASRKIRRGAWENVTGWTAVIGFGTYLGIIPQDLQHAVQGLGLTKVAADIFGALLSSRKAEATIGTEDLYFLWRVQQMAKRA